MSIVTDFNIATDLKVELFLPDTDSDTFILGLSVLGGDDVLGGVGNFILGQSLLGSTDVLGTGSAYVWQPVEADTIFAEFGVGGDIQDAYYFQPNAGSGRISLQSYEWDPNVNKNIRTNTKIRVRIAKNGVNHTLFTGYIDTINVQYSPLGWNRIDITAYDLYKAIVNSRIATFDNTGLSAGYATPLQNFAAAVTSVGAVMSLDSATTTGKIPLTSQSDIQANGILNEALQVGLAVCWVDPETEQVVFIPRPDEANGTSTTWIVGNDHGGAYHLCMSDITVAADADSIINSLYVDLASDDTQFVALEDQDSIELYGENFTSLSLNVIDTDELTTWASKVFNTTVTKLVKTVETPTIDREGNLTQASVMTPGQLLGVRFEKDQLAINEYYTITRVNHTIDVNSWYTQFELWKAA
jgi:hypothetical protein